MKTRLSWIIVFGLILMSTQIYHFISFSNTSFLLGLPDWLIYFVAIQLVFVIALYLLAQSLSKEEES